VLLFEGGEEISKVKRIVYFKRWESDTDQKHSAIILTYFMIFFFF
jgi:hypothetical protein